MTHTLYVLETAFENTLDRMALGFFLAATLVVATALIGVAI